MAHVGLARLGLLVGLVGLAGGCGRTAKPGPPSIAVALGAVRAASEELDLPEVKEVEPEPAGAAHVILSRSRLSLLGDPWPLAALPSPTDRARGFAAEDKRDGRESFRITPLEQALDWETAHEHASEPRPVLVLVGDAGTSYRMITEVVASAEGSYQVVFAARTREHDGRGGVIPLASFTSRHAPADRVEVRLDSEAFAVTVGKRSVAPGCEAVGPGPTIRRQRGVALDFTPLTSCLRAMQTANHALADHPLALGADADISFATLVKMIEAGRAAGFPEVTLLPPNPARSGAPP